MPFDFQAAQSRMQAFLSSSTSPRFILFKADWCGDCVRGVPPTRAAVAAAGAPLLEIDVGDAQRWRDPNHPLRTHPSFQLQGIPTLIEYSSTEKGRYHYLGTFFS